MPPTHPAAAGSLAVTVHGPAGVVDLVVPPAAAASDVAREYADQAGLSRPPVLGSRLGEPLPAEEPLVTVGVESGAVLVVLDAAGPAPHGRERGAPARRRTPARDARERAPHAPAGPAGWSVAWAALAAACAPLAAVVAAGAGGVVRDAVVVLLALAALVGLVPWGGHAAARAVAAPAFAGSAALAVVLEGLGPRLPTEVGVAALVAAMAAAVARSLATVPEEALRVWVVAGAGVFAVAFGGALVSAPTTLVWGVLLLVAVLAPRFVPGLAVDVPDQMLLDVERLAVTAWSARERPAGRRRRTVVTDDAVAAVAAHGARLLTASSVAVLAVVAVAAPALLVEARPGPDLVGARVMVGAGAAVLLLVARSYRHRAARGVLRAAGLLAAAALVADLGEGARDGSGLWLAVAAVLLAGVVVLAAVATGRGWRSSWWSRRAEVAEGLAVAVTCASLVAASGFFRYLWENVPDV